jgi:hypothetical protein
MSDDDSGPSPRRSWEDPHPGQKISIPVGAPAGLFGHPQFIGDGDEVSGVIAKAGGIHYSGRPMVRKSLRTRHRSTIPKPLKIPDQVPEEAESKSAPLRPCPAEFIIDNIEPVPADPKLELAKPLNPDTDTETEVVMTLEDSETDGAKIAPTSSCLTDFSNYLGVSIVDDDNNYDDASVTMVDSEAFSRMQSVEDLYGWDAELNRKTDHGVCACDQFQYRRAGGSKRSLLHRVFSSGRKT